MNHSQKKKENDKLLGILGYVESIESSLDYSTQEYPEIDDNIKLLKERIWSKIENYDFPTVNLYYRLKNTHGDEIIQLYDSPKQSLGKNVFQIRLDGFKNNLPTIELPNGKVTCFRPDRFCVYFGAKSTQEDYDEIYYLVDTYIRRYQK